MPVYLFGTVNGLHKIGRTRQMYVRSAVLSKLEAGSRMIHAIESCDLKWLEKTMHRAFFQQRVEGEWFRLTEMEVNRFGKLRTLNSADDLPRWITRNLQKYDAHLEEKKKSQLHVAFPEQLARDLRMLRVFRGISTRQAIETYLAPVIKAELKKVIAENMARHGENTVV